MKNFFVFFPILVSVFYMNAIPTHALDWTVTQIVNNPLESTEYSDVECDSLGNFRLAYPAGSPGSGSLDYLVYIRESADGEMWSEPEIIYDIQGNNQFADLKLLENDLGVFAFRRQRPDGNLFDIWFSREVAEGYWETERVTDDLNDDARPQMALLPDGRAVITYPRGKLNGSSNNMDIAVSIESEEGWNTIQLMEDTIDNHRPAVVCDAQGVIHLFYITFTGEGVSSRTGGGWDLFYTSYQNEVWSTAVNLTQLLQIADKADWVSAVITDDGVLHCFTPGGDTSSGESRDIYHLRMTNGEWNASKISDLSQPAEWLNASTGPNGSIHVVYQVGRVFRQTGTVPTAIYYQNWMSNQGWSDPEEIEDEWEDSEDPTIAVNHQGRVVVVYNAIVDGVNQLVAATALYPSDSGIKDWDIYE